MTNSLSRDMILLNLDDCVFIMLTKAMLSVQNSTYIELKCLAHVITDNTMGTNSRKVISHHCFILLIKWLFKIHPTILNKATTAKTNRSCTISIQL